MAGCADESLTLSAPAEPALESPLVLTELRLSLLRVEDPFRWDTEFRGLATMAMELGLSDLPGVVVRVPGHAAPPSVLVSLPVSRRDVDARFVVRGPADALELELELCVAGEGCASTTATATREAPWEAFGSLLEGAAGTLGFPMPEVVLAGWRAPGSKDPYAELITGRAAATHYGLLPVPEDPTDKRANPILRAVLLDPRQPLAQWVLARWEIGSTADGGVAAPALIRASLARPWSPILDADLATLLSATNQADSAVLAWERLGERCPGDPRFLEPSARALHAAGRSEDAQAALSAFPAEFYWEPRVAALRVEVVEAAEGTAGLDPLLAHWQGTDSKAVEPVRRRIELRVQDRRFEDALPLLAALRTRAPGPQTDALEVALLTAVGRYADAAAEAPNDVATRLRSRLAREDDPGAAPVGLPETDTEGRLAMADAALWRGQAKEAALISAGVITEHPWRADAYALRARALEALGRGGEASVAWGRAWDIDPALEGGPVGGGRVVSTFQYVVAAPIVSEPSARPQGPEL